MSIEDLEIWWQNLESMKKKDYYDKKDTESLVDRDFGQLVKNY